MAPPTYHPESVTITLRSTRPTTNNQTRNIILRPDVPVNVGRSSRSEAKNLSATADNALFDCPVISRRHAEFELRVNKWSEPKHQVYIKDTGSMHGTSVNGLKLQPLKLFQLQKGDTIRLGDSVNRNDNSYDGVTVTLDCISTATKKDYAQVKASQPGISVPSDSESEFDDEDDEDEDDSDDGADLHPSSAHTTPDQATAKSASQLAGEAGPAASNVIMLEDDDDDEPVPLFSRRATTDSVVIPDTFADEPAMTEGPQSFWQFNAAHEAKGVNRDVREVMAEMVAAETGPDNYALAGHDRIDDEADDRASLNPWLPDGDEDSDEQSDSQAPFDRQSFLSEEFNMADEAAMIDDDEDEGPEIMSSKLRPSQELGTLGDKQTNDAAKPVRPHYDPVRELQWSAPSASPKAPAYHSYGAAPFASDYRFADPGYSKWDVKPAGFQLPHADPVSSDYAGIYTLSSYPQPFSFTNPHDWPASNLNASAHELAHQLDPISMEHGVGSMQGSGVAENNAKKRKASDVFPAGEHITAAEIVEEKKTSVHDEAAATDVVAPIEPSSPHAKKRKIKQPRAQRSMLRTAAIEAGKYTAGAIIGGIGLVAILASPVGEALASC